VFDWSEDDPLQIVIEGLKPEIHVIEVELNDSQLATLLKNERSLLKPVSDAPPIRFTIVEGSRRLLILTYHHIILDGPSIFLLLDMLLGEYIPNTSDAHYYLNWYEENVGIDEHAAWRNHFSDIAAYHGRIAGKTTQSALQHYEQTLPATLRKGLIAASKDFHTTPAVYIQSLWSAWAARYFQLNRFLYGLVVTTRLPDMSDYELGPYISTVPWIVDVGNASFAEIVQNTAQAHSHTLKAKHLPLGEIIRHTSPAAASFDSILTIASRESHIHKPYSVRNTYENTGYKLSVDITLSSTITISFSGYLTQTDRALASFIDYCNKQIGLEDLQSIVGIFDTKAVRRKARSQITPPHQAHTVLCALSEALDIPLDEIDQAYSFLDLGGDSISALRLKSFLRDQGLEISINDIIQSVTVKELIHSTKTLKRTDHINAIHSQEIHERITPTPPAALSIVRAYTHGLGQDYHEQTGFHLRGSLDSTALQKALVFLSEEMCTLRIFYTSANTATQRISTRSRTEYTHTTSKYKGFREFIDYTSDEDWRRPFDIEEQALLRVVTCSGPSDSWYLFMSFSALVTDGWSFSIFLERLFTIYGQIINKVPLSHMHDSYLEYCTLLSPVAPENDNKVDSITGSYTSNIASNRFKLSKKLTTLVVHRSKAEHQTLAQTLQEAVAHTLQEQGYSELCIYESGRNASKTLHAIGPLSRVSKRRLQSISGPKAYFVFENYPKESENRLRNQNVMYFSEQGDWRRDLLPPFVDIGYVFDLQQDGRLTVDILTRSSNTQGEQIAKDAWEYFISTINKET
jgi:aryl carrier-like protein